MGRAIRCSWVAAILTIVGCWTAPDASSGATASTGTGGGATTASTGTGGGATSTATGTFTRAPICGKTYSPPAQSCNSPCLVTVEEGQAPVVLYDRSTPTAYGVRDVLAVTDDFVVATAYSSPSTWNIVEIPRAGDEPPVLVDTLGVNDRGFSTTAIDGGDGYVYYAASPLLSAYPPLDPLSASTRLARLSLTTRGEQASVLATAPSVEFGLSLALGAGYLYVAGDFGIARVASEGGALEMLTQDSAELGIALDDTWVYFTTLPHNAETAVVGRIPLDGTAPFAPLGGGGDVAFGGAPSALFVSQYSQVLRFDAPTASWQSVLDTAIGTFPQITFLGTRFYVLDACPQIPAGSAPGSFHRSYDTITGEIGLLEGEPGYPFVQGSTGFAHDASGKVIVYVQ